MNEHAEKGILREMDNNPERIEQVFEFVVPKNQKPERIDNYITRQVMNATRTKVQKAIDTGRVEINGTKAKASRKVQPGDQIVCRILKLPPIELIPQNIPLDIIFEDRYFLVVNKPAGMCTHPGIGNRYGTLVNALLYHMGHRDKIMIESHDDEDEEEQDEGAVFAGDEVRPGIVHRLDKDTSGLLVIAKDPETHVLIQKQFYDRSISREYFAIVWGRMKEESGTIIGDIGRSSKDRKKFAVVKKGGKYAHTDFFLEKDMNICSLVRLKLQTGRTHQIRVHMSHSRHPIVGDATYGGDTNLYSGANPLFKKLAAEMLKISHRQLLHAKNLTLRHPYTHQIMNFYSEMPEDMQKVINIVENN